MSPINMFAMSFYFHLGLTTNVENHRQKKIDRSVAFSCPKIFSLIGVWASLLIMTDLRPMSEMPIPRHSPSTFACIRSSAGGES